MVNIGCGQDVTIAELVGMVAEAVGFEGEVEFDSSKPDGTPQKLLDVSRMGGMGWRSNIALPVGIGLAYKDFQEIWVELGARGLGCEGARHDGKQFGCPLGAAVCEFQEGVVPAEKICG